MSGGRKAFYLSSTVASLHYYLSPPPSPTLLTVSITKAVVSIITKSFVCLHHHHQDFCLSPPPSPTLTSLHLHHQHSYQPSHHITTPHSALTNIPRIWWFDKDSWHVQDSNSCHLPTWAVKAWRERLSWLVRGVDPSTRSEMSQKLF